MPPTQEPENVSQTAVSSQPATEDTELNNNTQHDVEDDLQAGKSAHVAQNAKAKDTIAPEQQPVEHGGQAGLEPTRYGDWEKKGRCTDF